jgi:hypothetical protein
MSRRLIVTFPCTLLLLAALARADEPVRPAQPAADRVKLVRQMYAKLPSGILGFAEPAKRIVVAQKDGRSLMLLLEDANDRPLTIHLLHGRLEPEGSLLLASGRLPLRGPEESAVYGLLLRLADKRPNGATEQQVQLLDAILAALDRRFAGAVPLASPNPGG